MDVAEPLHKRSLAIREKVLGPEHPDFARSLASWGLVLALKVRTAVSFEEISWGPCSPCTPSLPLDFLLISPTAYPAGHVR